MAGTLLVDSITTVGTLILDDVTISTKLDLTGAETVGLVPEDPISEAPVDGGTYLRKDGKWIRNIQTNSDIAPVSPTEGDTWYCTLTDGRLDNAGELSVWIAPKVYAWTSRSPLLTARNSLAGCGTTDAALSFGGSPHQGWGNETEHYNGTTWSAGGDLITARDQLAGCGTTDAALSFGGWDDFYEEVTEHYNGTSWSAGGNLITRQGLAGCGTTTAALSFGGYSTGYGNETEHYNGTTWLAGGDLITARHDLAGCGTTTAALSFGGSKGNYINVTEHYNGTTWSAGGDLITARAKLAGCGTSSAALSFGGQAGNDNETEHYNGSTWSAGEDLITARYELAGCGITDAALSFGGQQGTTYRNDTEEYVVSFSGLWVPMNEGLPLPLPEVIKNVIVDVIDYQSAHIVWDTGPEIDLVTGYTVVGLQGGFVQDQGGDTNDRIISGLTGSTFYNFGVYATNGSGQGVTGYGNQIETPVTPPNPIGWSSRSAMLTARRLLSGCGTPAAALSFGGSQPMVSGPTNATESYDGTSWTTGGNLIKTGSSGLRYNYSSIKFRRLQYRLRKRNRTLRWSIMVNRGRPNYRKILFRRLRYIYGSIKFRWLQRLRCWRYRIL